LPIVGVLRDGAFGRALSTCMIASTGSSVVTCTYLCIVDGVAVHRQ
jgi:hypothetical protein